ncbi:macrocin O-methyltransferase [Aequorivita sp. H23M31]|uniref:Macrocin O-methyltransferase n=1 Tax=Aequorivita ciconiae TaxID=2494375 RepID=A0A410G298_9FLAO|nr:TylF/MycF/NovP-related O-methyltransferase [Aequorivita sp. H23M31]QAA81373.1 macrocin O-methyltransferase [Aequorivita sp. H23M31]
MIKKIKRKLGHYFREENGTSSGNTDTKKNYFPADFTESDIKIIDAVKNYTMTSSERIKVLLEAVDYIDKNKIPGDYVECGVWKGGSSLAVAMKLEEIGNLNKNIWLFDTFEGMSEPTEFDEDLKGRLAKDRLAKEDKELSWVWAYSGLDEVKKTMQRCNYPKSKIKFIKGKVEETLLSKNIPDRISILRLDTDWYESTKMELEILFPRVVEGGIIIIDDYGHWKGSKKAVDEYLSQIGKPIFLNRIDYTARLIIKN